MQRVISLLRNSLNDLKLAIEGTIIMSEVGVAPLLLERTHLCMHVSVCVRGHAHTRSRPLHVESRGATSDVIPQTPSFVRWGLSLGPAHHPLSQGNWPVTPGDPPASPSPVLGL